MSDADIAARLTAEASRAAGAESALLSISIEMFARAEIASVRTKIERKTRAFVFVTSDAQSADGQRVASAMSVHKLEG